MSSASPRTDTPSATVTATPAQMAAGTVQAPQTSVWTSSAVLACAALATTLPASFRLPMAERTGIPSPRRCHTHPIAWPVTNAQRNIPGVSRTSATMVATDPASIAVTRPRSVVSSGCTVSTAYEPATTSASHGCPAAVEDSAG